MKKSLTSIAIGMLLFPIVNVSADTTVITAHEEPTVVEPVEENCLSDFGGVNFILGVGGSFLNVKAEDRVKISKDVNRFIGVIGLGGGKVFKNEFYVGGEALFDFTKEEKYDVSGVLAEMKSGGFFSSVGLRVGYVVPQYGLMTYFRVAGSHSKASGKVKASGEKLECSKIVPTLALGIEKAFCKKFTARLEGEYRFKATKSDKGVKLTANNGFNVRALISYNVHF